MNRGPWIVVAALSAVLIAGLGLGGGVLIGRASLSKSVDEEASRVSAAEAGLEDARERTDNLEGDLAQAVSRIADLESALSASEERLGVANRERSRLWTAMNWCEILIEYVNTNGFYSGIGRAGTADGFYERANKCIRPTGNLYE